MNNVHWGIWPFHTFDRVITHGDFIFIVSSLHRVIASSCHRLYSHRFLMKNKISNTEMTRQRAITYRNANGEFAIGSPTFIP